jgi:Na+-transporting NADH:ubiquinone oxidoreductase subunit NqrC
MKKIIFVVLVILLLSFLGCGIVLSPKEMVMKNKEIKSFLVDHNKATIDVNIYSASDLEADRNFWITNCKTMPEAKEYYIAILDDDNATLKALFTKGEMNLICGVLQNKIYVYE